MLPVPSFVGSLLSKDYDHMFVAFGDLKIKVSKSEEVDAKNVFSI